MYIAGMSSARGVRDADVSGDLINASMYGGGRLLHLNRSENEQWNRHSCS